MSRELNSIVRDFINGYWAPDGLARLDKSDKHPPFLGEVVPTVNNENGILFLAEIMLEFKLQGVDSPHWPLFVRKSREALENLRIPNSACYNRRPGQVMMNSHDNLIGIVVLCQVMGFEDDLKRLHKWGTRNFWSFNNIDPDKWWDLRAWLQPRDQALVRLAVGRPPGLISAIWLMGAVLTKSKHKRMMRLRMESVKMSFPKGILSRYLQWWWGKWGGYDRFALECAEYYEDPENPYRRLTALSVSTDP